MATGNTPRYNKIVCFDPFSFPDFTPEQKQKIRALGDRLDSHRKQVQAAHPIITITGSYNLLENLDRLQWLGVTIEREDAGIMYWQYAER